MSDQGWKKQAWGWARELALAAAFALLLRASVADARKVPTPSMDPTVQVNERVFVEKAVMHFTGLHRGDIILFKPPFPSEDPYLKRVIGLPGDTVTVEHGVVKVNGVELKEPYIKEAPKYTYGPVTVPEGKLLVLGDNRNNSYDSHYWGLLDRSAVEGRAWVRYWPLNRLKLLE